MNENELFERARQLSTDERMVFLERECPDPVLRARVEELLAAEDASQSTLESQRYQTLPHQPSSFVDPAATAAVPPGPTSEEETGEVIAGRYRLRRQIGEGGMGTVWMADQTEPVVRSVALKLIRIDRGQSKMILARFEAERQAIAMMDHPHIAKLLDAGTTATGAPYFVMELVDGIPLNEFCDQNRLTVQERLKLFVQICSAVQHAHQKGIIHRDLKPSNILVQSLDGKPVPKVIDFGLAKATSGLQLTEQSLLTGFGTVMGTPLYMAPEQASFNTVDVDTRADVYSLGVILYELLTSTTPLTKETIKTAALDELLRLVREEEAPAPSSRLSSSDNVPLVASNRQIDPALLGRFVKGELDWIVGKALSKERDRRYDTANGFANDIERFLNKEPVTAGPPSARYRLKKFIQRNRGQVVAASLLLLALVAGFVGTTIGLIEADQQAVKANAEMIKAQEATQEASKQLSRAEGLVYSGKLASAQRAFTDGNGDVALRHLEACQWNLRGWEHRHLETRFNSKQTLLGHTNWVNCVSWSPDGKRIVSGSADLTAKVWDAETGREVLVLAGHTKAVNSLAWSPDGKRILTGSDDMTAKVWDAETGQEIFTLTGHTKDVSSVAWSPNGQLVLTGSEDNTAKIWNADTGMELLSLNGHSQAVFGVAWSPDGGRIVTGSQDNTAKVWSAESGQELLTLQGHLQWVNSVAWSPDGLRILTGSYDMTAKVWDASTSQTLFDLKGHTYWVNSVAWSPDGGRILTGSWDKTAKVWNARTGQEIFALKGHVGQVAGAAWSPDGRRIVTGSYDRATKVWDADLGQDVVALKGHKYWVSSVVWSPNGKRILTASWDKSVRIWDVEKAREILAITENTGQVSSAVWSPDGGRILTGSYDNTAKIWNAETGQELFVLEGHTDRLDCVAWSRDGQRVLTGSWDKTAKVWDAETGKEVLSLTGHTAAVYGVCWSPDGKRILTGSEDKTARIWNAQTGEEVLTLNGHTGQVAGASWSRDGCHVLTASYDETARVWDAETGEEILTLVGHTGYVNMAEWSPDGQRILTASEDMTARVWNAANGQEVLTLSGHTGWVYRVAWSPDGQRIGTASFDMTAKVWEADKGKNVRTLVGHTQDVSSVAWSPDGLRILTGSKDRSAKIWDAEKGQEILALKGHTQDITNVAWSPDGQQAYAWDEAGKVLCWDARTGKPFEAEFSPTQAAPSAAKSPDGRFMATLDNVKVQVIDLLGPSSTDSSPWTFPDAIDRKDYHVRQADLAEIEKNDFAAAFHVGRLLLDDPDNIDLKNRLKQAIKNQTGSELTPKPQDTSK